MNFRLLALFSFMVTVWSLSFVVIKSAAREIPPVMLSALRATGSALVMIPVAWWDSRRHPHSRWNWADAPKLAAAAMCGITLNQLLFVMGVSRTSVAHAAIVMALGPVVVYILAMAMGLEHARLMRFLGMGIAMAGVGVLQFSKGGETSATVAGDLLIFGGTSAFAGYTVLGKSLTTRYGSIYVTAISFALGALVLIPIAWFSGQRVEWAAVSLRAWLSLLYLIVIHSVICYLIFYHLLTHVSASRVSLFSYIQPVLASIFAWLLIAEPVTASVATGGALVTAGVWLAERKR